MKWVLLMKKMLFSILKWWRLRSKALLLGWRICFKSYREWLKTSFWFWYIYFIQMSHWWAGDITVFWMPRQWGYLGLLSVMISNSNERVLVLTHCISWSTFLMMMGYLESMKDPAPPFTQKHSFVCPHISQGIFIIIHNDGKLVKRLIELDLRRTSNPRRSSSNLILHARGTH